MSSEKARKGTYARTTSETQIEATINLDGSGKFAIETPVPFLTHMLEQLPRHGLFDLEIKASGDTEIDAHHTVEDTGIVFGRALLSALGDRRGIRRYGSATLVMDEARVQSALDLSGRAFFVWQADFPKAKIGEFDAELVEVFFEAVARSAQMNLHIEKQAGQNLHHIAEIAFKAFARALRAACELDPRAANAVPSTKGSLD